MSKTDIDTLWQLQNALKRTPRWHSFKITGLANDEDSDYDSDGPPKLTPIGKKREKKQLQITRGGEDGSDDSMPGLQSVSNSSDDEESDEDSASEDDDDDDDSDDESGYDTEQEDEMRDMLREAMDTAIEADFFALNADAPPELDPLADDRKSNPFLKLLGSLRGEISNAIPEIPV